MLGIGTERRRKPENALGILPALVIPPAVREPDNLTPILRRLVIRKATERPPVKRKNLLTTTTPPLRRLCKKGEALRRKARQGREFETGGTRAKIEGGPLHVLRRLWTYRRRV